MISYNRHRLSVLGTHFTRASDVIVPDHLTASPSVPTPYRSLQELVQPYGCTGCSDATGRRWHRRSVTFGNRINWLFGSIGIHRSRRRRHPGDNAYRFWQLRGPTQKQECLTNLTY